jgi:hypothetical protein
MPLIKEGSEKATYVNVSKGKFYTKESGKDPVFYGELEGYITAISFIIDEYQGKKFEKCQIHVVDDNDIFILKIKVDSRYFRTFCNFLKNANIYDKIRFSPYYKEEQNGYKNVVMFLKQNSVALKSYHTKDNPRGLPDAPKINFKGEETTDFTQQNEYYKNYLRTLKFVSTQENESGSDVGGKPTTTTQNDLIDDDLPF